jgi:acetyl esterase/lipase
VRRRYRVRLPARPHPRLLRRLLPPDRLGPTELPLPTLAAQAAITGWAARSGAPHHARGRAGLLLSAASAVQLERRARRSRVQLEVALQAGLGSRFRAYDATPGPGVPISLRPGVGRRRRPAWNRMVRTARARRLYLHAADVPYGPHGTSNHLDIWAAKDVARVEPAPVLVPIPGGGYVAGNKRGQACSLMTHLADHGWLCVSLNYRLAPKAPWPAPIVDVKRALAWVRANIAEYGGDPGFVAVTGGSAGAQLAALAALTPGDLAFQPGFEEANASVQAAVPFYVVYDWTPPATWPAMQAYLVQFGIMRRPYAEDAEPYEAASPARRIGAAPPPFSPCTVGPTSSPRWRRRGVSPICCGQRAAPSSSVSCPALSTPSMSWVSPSRSVGSRG